MNRRPLTALLTLLLSAAAIFLPRVCSAGGWGSRRVIVVFKPGVSRTRRDSLLSKLNARRLKSIEARDGFLADVAQMDGQTGADLSQLARDPSYSDMIQVEDDYRANWLLDDGPGLSDAVMSPFAAAAPSGAAVAAAPAPAPQQDIPWGVARVQAPQEWNSTVGAGVKVCVVDTGIDYTHPDLSANVAGGYGIIASSSDPQYYKDDNGHGTHVAGIIAGEGANGGVYGVAPRAKLYAVKVMDSQGQGNLSDIINGIVWCADNGMQAANMSIGGPTSSPALQQAIQYAASRGVVLVAAAGNSGGAVSYPAAYPEVIAVSASDINNQIAPFSSRGPQVAFIAPGVNITSTFMGGGYKTLSGTSMASPHVTGLAALAISLGNGAAQVRSALSAAAAPLAGLSSVMQGSGLIDAGRLSSGSN